MSISPGAGLQFVFDSIFSCLSKEEQLKLIYLFTKLEKDCVVAEREKFNYLCDEFKITTITKQNIIGYCECLPFNDENNLEIVMDEIEKIVIKNKQDTYTEQSKKMQYFIVWTLLNFAHIDEKITQSEEKVIFYLIDFWNMDKILVSNMFDTLNTVSLLQKQIEFLKTTDMPYEKTHSHIEQCEKEIKQIYKDIEITLA